MTGALLLVGLFTRPTALIVGVELFAAYVLVAAPRGPWPIGNGGSEGLLVLTLAVYLCFRDAGRRADSQLATDAVVSAA